MLRLRKNGRAKRNILFKYARWSKEAEADALSCFERPSSRSAAPTAPAIRVARGNRSTAAEAAAPKTGAGSAATQPTATKGVGLVVHSDLLGR